MGAAISPTQRRDAYKSACQSGIRIDLTFHHAIFHPWKMERHQLVHPLSVLKQKLIKGIPLMSRALCSEVSSEGSLRSCDCFTVFYGLYGIKGTSLKSEQERRTLVQSRPQRKAGFYVVIFAEQGNLEMAIIPVLLDQKISSFQGGLTKEGCCPSSIYFLKIL